MQRSFTRFASFLLILFDLLCCFRSVRDAVDLASYALELCFCDEFIGAEDKVGATLLAEHVMLKWFSFDFLIFLSTVRASCKGGHKVALGRLDLVIGFSGASAR